MLRLSPRRLGAGRAWASPGLAPCPCLRRARREQQLEGFIPRGVARLGQHPRAMGEARSILENARVGG